MAQRSRSRTRNAKPARPAPAAAKSAASVPPAATPPSSGLPATLARRLVEVGERIAATGGMGVRVGTALLMPGSASRMRREAGKTLRELRELAGLTRDELAEAIELSDRSLLSAVEKGTAALSFELILRLSALLARNDPVPFVVQMTRSYNPGLWKLLEGWGIVRIPLQLERERRFLNVYRAHDVARKLSDEGFEHVLRMTQAAFEMALDFAAVEEGIADDARRARRKTPRRRRAARR